MALSSNPWSPSRTGTSTCGTTAIWRSWSEAWPAGWTITTTGASIKRWITASRGTATGRKPALPKRRETMTTGTGKTATGPRRSDELRERPILAAKPRRRFPSKGGNQAKRNQANRPATPSLKSARHWLRGRDHSTVEKPSLTCLASPRVCSRAATPATSPSGHSGSRHGVCPRPLPAPSTASSTPPWKASASPRAYVRFHRVRT